MSERRAVIVGHKGQDGSLLNRKLCERSDHVVGIDLDVTERVGAKGTEGHVRIEDSLAVAELVREFMPDQIYYLAAHHRSSEVSGEKETISANFHFGLRVNVGGVVNFLDAIRQYAPQARLFYASSSLIFGAGRSGEVQDEETPWTPACEYGLMKALGMQACRMYRDQLGLFASSGILYNHESAYRSEAFISKKVIVAALRNRAGSSEKLIVGDLNAVTDWSYAPDFADAFTRILDLDCSTDFIVASGEGHTVGEFVAIAYAHLGLDWRDYVLESPRLLHRPWSHRVGNARKLMDATGWRPSLSFREMVQKLVDDVARSQSH